MWRLLLCVVLLTGDVFGQGAHKVIDSETDLLALASDQLIHSSVELLALEDFDTSLPFGHRLPGYERPTFSYSYSINNDPKQNWHYQHNFASARDDSDEASNSEDVSMLKQTYQTSNLNNLSPPEIEKEYLPPPKIEQDYLPPPKIEQDYLPPPKIEQDYLPPPKIEQDYFPPPKIEQDYLPPPKIEQDYFPPPKIEQDYFPPPKIEQDYLPPPKIEQDYLPPPKIEQDYLPPPKIEQDYLPPPKIEQEYLPPPKIEQDYLPPKIEQDYFPPSPSKLISDYLPPDPIEHNIVDEYSSVEESKEKEKVIEPTLEYLPPSKSSIITTHKPVPSPVKINYFNPTTPKTINVYGQLFQEAPELSYNPPSFQLSLSLPSGIDMPQKSPPKEIESLIQSYNEKPQAPYGLLSTAVDKPIELETHYSPIGINKSAIHKKAPLREFLEIKNERIHVKSSRPNIQHNAIEIKNSYVKPVQFQNRYAVEGKIENQDIHAKSEKKPTTAYGLIGKIVDQKIHPRIEHRNVEPYAIVTEYKNQDIHPKSEKKSARPYGLVGEIVDQKIHPRVEDRYVEPYAIVTEYKNQDIHPKSEKKSAKPYGLVGEIVDQKIHPKVEHRKVDPYALIVEIENQKIHPEHETIPTKPYALVGEVKEKRIQALLEKAPLLPEVLIAEIRNQKIHPKSEQSDNIRDATRADNYGSSTFLVKDFAEKKHFPYRLEGKIVNDPIIPQSISFSRNHNRISSNRLKESNSYGVYSESYFDCTENRECREREVCQNGFCTNGCSIASAVCIGNAQCETRYHVPACICPPSFTARTIRMPNGQTKFDCMEIRVQSVQHRTSQSVAHSSRYTPFSYHSPFRQSSSPISGSSQFSSSRQNACSPTPCGDNTRCEINRNGIALCRCIADYVPMGNTIQGCKPQCVSDSECPDDYSCRRNKCERVCTQGSCGLNADCDTRNHQAICSCPRGYNGSPDIRCIRAPPIHNEPEHREIDPCNPSPCGTNANCRNRNDRAVCSCPLGSTNVQNLTKAFFLGLLNQKTHEQMAEEKKLHVVKLAPGDYPRVVASPKDKVRTREEIPYDEELDYSLYTMDGRVVLPRKKFEPFYKRMPSYERFLNKEVKRRNHTKINLQLRIAHGGRLESFYTKDYPECKEYVYVPEEKEVEEEEEY